MELTIRPATTADIQHLAQMNRQLCDDERSRNPMTVAALAVRIEKWLNEDWKAVLFEESTMAVGYSVFQIGSDYYYPTIPEVHIQQFFIVRERRYRGVGRQAFALLCSTMFPPESQIHLDVLVTNPGGQHFWESVGFQAYSMAMRLVPEKTADRRQ